MRDRSDALVIYAGGAAAVVAAVLFKEFLASGKKFKFVIDFCAGGVAGAIAKTLTAPIENCKNALQCQEIHPDVRAGRIKRYNGIADYFRSTVNERGVLALWEGNMINVLRYFPTQAANFVFKDKIKALFPKYNAKTEFKKFFAANMASGGLAGAISLSIVYPLDYVYTIIRYDLSGKYGEVRRREGSLGVAKAFVRKRGVLALYSGFGISVLGIVLYRGPYFGMFDTLKSLNPFMKDKGFLGMASKFAIAQTTAIFAGFVSYPLDTVRRRMLMDAAFPADGKEPTYRGAWHCLLTIVEEEGVLALFSGFGANVLRTLAGAFILVGYDVFKKAVLVKALKK